MEELKAKARELCGASLEALVAYAKFGSIEKYFVEDNQDFIVYTVTKQGCGCLILSSSNYPGVGILIFDVANADGGITMMLRVCGDDEHNPRFSIVCGCCRPHTTGVISKRSFGEWEGDKQLFNEAIRVACKENKISTLVFYCASALNVGQEKDGLHIEDLSNIILGKEVAIDSERFRAAFWNIRHCDGRMLFKKDNTAQQQRDFWA